MVAAQRPIGRGGSGVASAHLGKFSLGGLVLTVVCDAAPLITACKFVVEGTLIIDHLLSVCRLVIAPRVEE